MNDDNREIRVMREVTEREDKVLRILEAVNYAKIENITIKDGKVRTLEVRLLLDFDKPHEFQRAVDELKMVPLL